ncbi:MAG: DUF4381 domain-containing protein [Legionellaceae bacterium]|nr:DUF4381 domain-containing protein [Legionellaceae bacterium]
MDNLQTMSQTKELAKLHDIRLPDPISFWPLAPGWYLLILLVVLLGIIAYFVILRHYSLWQVKRRALAILAMHRAEYLADSNSQRACATVNELLKKVAIAYYPRQLVAGLQGRAWISFLNKTYQYDSQKKRVFNKILCKKKKNPTFDSLQKELLEYPYQESRKVNLDALFNLSESWIKRQKKLKSTTKERLCLN